MFTLTEINAVSGDALTRLAVRVQDAALEDQKDTNAKSEASAAIADAEAVKQTGALDRMAAALAVSAESAVDVLQPAQRLWVELYQTHLKTRREPAIITSATGDQVVKDIVLDAVMMTNEVFAQVKAAMAALQIPPGGVDWT